MPHASKSMVKSYSIVGITDEMNFKNKKSAWSGRMCLLPSSIWNVCAYVRKNISCIFVRMCAYVSVCVKRNAPDLAAYIWSRSRSETHIHIHIHIHMHTHIHIDTNPNKPVQWCASLPKSCICIGVYTHACTYIHMHIHKLKRTWSMMRFIAKECLQNTWNH